MTIEKITPGGGKPERYFIRNEAGTTLAWFDRLDVAACVLRYLKGAPMPTADADIQRNTRKIYISAGSEAGTHNIEKYKLF